ncbi:transposase [Halomarina litorea]|uniref:transposase n=1 Tax=Halomarina litorea TaxID=2961595 RepID=UPI0020C34967|nr:transposase [Halomarina sp. BCD28]
MAIHDSADSVNNSPTETHSDARQAAYVAFLHRVPFAIDALTLGFLPGFREDCTYQQSQFDTLECPVGMLDNDFRNPDLDRNGLHRGAQFGEFWTADGWDDSGRDADHVTVRKTVRHVSFRISAKPYKHVTGVLEGSDGHLDILTTALESDQWKIGTAEALFHNDNPELHVTVTNTEQTVRNKQDSQTVVGVDVNEDNVALTALSENGVEDTLVIDLPEIKFERHRYFTMRKRVQNAGKDSLHDTLDGREERFVRDRLHKVSRHIVEWSQQFEKPCIVFEDLKEMRDSIDYGTRMNRRLHHLPFRALQFYTSYKASFEGIPTGWINPEYTSQQCPLCGHTERANRNKKRFKCKDCAHQDHSDRGASINIAVKGTKDHQDWNVPALNNLPQVRKVRRRASGAVDAPTVTHPTVQGSPADGQMGVSD